MLRNEQIYEALFDDEAFQGLPDLLATAVGGRSGLINWAHSDGEVSSLAYSYFTDEFMDRYVRDFIEKDLWAQTSLLPHRRNTVYQVAHEISAGAFAHSEIYNELIRDLGDDTFHCIGGSFFSAWGGGLFGLHRSKTDAPFSEVEVALLSQYALPFRTVLMVKGEIAARHRETGLAKGALDALAVASLVVSDDMRVLHANAAGEAILAARDGVFTKNGFLGAQIDQANRRLAAAVAAATAPLQPAAAALLIPRVFHGAGEPPPYQVTVTPLIQGGRSRALLIIRDVTRRDSGLSERLRGLFGLTPAEAELAVALAEGASLADIAARRGVQEGTVRVQIKAVAAKMNVSRQAQIASIVAGLPQLRHGF